MLVGTEILERTGTQADRCVGACGACELHVGVVTAAAAAQPLSLMDRRVWLGHRERRA